LEIFTSTVKDKINEEFRPQLPAQESGKVDISVMEMEKRKEGRKWHSVGPNVC